MSVTMEDIRTYGFAEAIRQHFKRRAEARKPPPTESERLRRAIEDICHYSHEDGPSPYKVGLYSVSDSHDFYEGETSTSYRITYSDTLIWSGTSYGYFNPFNGRWHVAGPWQDNVLAVLEARVSTLKARHIERREARRIQEQLDYEAEVRAAEERHQKLIRQFHEENRV